MTATASRQQTRPRILILAFSEVFRDARVLRQVEYLAPHFDIVLGGWGRPVEQHGVRWVELPSRRSLAVRMAGHFLLLLGRVWPRAHRWWFRFRPSHVAAEALALRERCDVYYANDWVTLPAAAAGAAKHGGKLVLDAHEYSPLEWESSRLWRLLYRPLVLRVFREYASRCDATVTVSQPIAERYAREYPIRPIVVMNAPKLPAELPPSTVSPGDRMRLVHHGSAIRERRLEQMIDAIALAGERFSLDLMLLGDSRYIEQLERYAAARAPGRVAIRPAVVPSAIVNTLAQYDIGLYLLDSDMFNHAMAMPNKIFDFVAAGLAVCIGPSPAMREIVERHGFGRVCPSTSPADCARVLDGLTTDDVASMKAAARRARAALNADVEMAKLVALLTSLLPARVA